MNKNHALDNLIIDASKKEFLAKGYTNASLRKIASNAGVTVGAIYTRYQTKDMLFYSLVEPLIDKVKKVFSELTATYFVDNIKENFINTLKLESNMILQLLFDDYESSYLLLCRSKGSNIENFFEMIINKKYESTIKFFNLYNIKLDKGVVKLLINCQFNSYYQIIANGYKLDEAKKMMNEVMNYHLGGWLTILNLK